MRIVGGRLKGRTITATRSNATRPTSDRVREAVFNILTHGPDYPEIENARVIDLFAGTGALGIEAVSRGAAFALFVEQAADARAAIQTNIEALSLQGATKIFRRDATALGPMGRGATYDIAFLDPPYGKGLGEKAVASLIAGHWLSPGAAIVLEERADALIALPPGVEQCDTRDYGDTKVIFARLTGGLSA